MDGTLVDSNYHHALSWFPGPPRARHHIPIWTLAMTDEIEVLPNARSCSRRWSSTSAIRR